MTTLLEFSARLARNVGISEPTVLVSSTDRTEQEILELANETGRELRRRYDWSELYETTTLTGTSAAAKHNLPADFSRGAKGVAVTFGSAIVRPLTQREWGGLSAAVGSPRYYLLEGNTVELWPYMASGETATFGYISENWCSGGDSFANDTDTVKFPDGLFLAGLIVRWRRQKGMEYADFEAEYEASIRDHAQFDRNMRF